MRVDGDLKQRLGETVCHRCADFGRHTEGAFAIVGLDFPAFGRVVCGHTLAGVLSDIRDGEIHFIDWLEKPKELARARRRTKTRKVDDLTDRCEICHRHQSELHPPAKLDTHHAVEVQHEGEDQEANLRVYCTDCHSLIHWLRRTMGRPHAE